MRARLFSAALLLTATFGVAGGPPGSGEVPNQLFNGDFEQGIEGWNAWGGQDDDENKLSGQKSLLVYNTAAKWSGADQILALPAGVATVEVSGWIRTSRVMPGRETWEMARIAIEFLDAAGTLVGGYPAPVGQYAGSVAWNQVRRSYQPPAGARKVRVQCALANAMGAAYFDDVQVVFRSASGKALVAQELNGPMDQGKWFAVPSAGNAGHFVDWSSLLDAPAGKHGWVRSNAAGQFEFENGTPVRFWGVNLVEKHVFRDKASSDTLAERLARMGANMVRLHHIDAPWSRPNVFGNNGQTRKLDPVALDQMDYLVASLKRKGIYVFLDLLVHREFTAADSVDGPASMGAKQVGIFSKRLIELQKEYATSLLNHVNPYTKLAWKDDPAIAMAEYINESTIFTSFEGDQIEGVYREELQRKWTDAGNLGPMARFSLDWSRPRPRLKFEGDKPQETLRFMAGLERAYYDTMRTAIRATGARLLLTGTNFPPPILATLGNNADQDLIITNEYWDHPQVWKINNDWNRIMEAPLDNASQLMSPATNLVATRSWARVEGKPLVVTEWNHCFPNEYELEGAPLLSSYAGLQDWSGLLQFDFEREGVGQLPYKRYTLSRSPVMLAQWVAAAPSFLRRDIRPSDTVRTEVVGPDKSLSTPSYSDWLDRHPDLPYRVRVSKRFDSTASVEPVVDTPDTTMRASTGELELDSRTGILQLRSPRLQGAVGFVGGKTFAFPRWSFQLQNTHASLQMVSADGLPIDSSRHLYLVAVGPAKMTGQQFTRSRTVLASSGEPPLLAQVLEGAVQFARADIDTIEVVGRDPDGTASAPIALDSGKLDLRQGRWLVYEIKIRPGIPPVVVPEVVAPPVEPTPAAPSPATDTGATGS